MASIKFPNDFDSQRERTKYFVSLSFEDRRKYNAQAGKWHLAVNRYANSTGLKPDKLTSKALALEAYFSE